MPFGEPEISEFATYSVMLQNDPSIPDSSAFVSVTLEPGEEGWTQDGTDALFQQLLDYLAAAPFLVPASGAEALEGHKNQAVNTTAAPTPEPEPEP
jgi:hypothetical protein